MVLLSELISKRVISIADAKDEGTVLNALFNKTLTAITFLKLFNEDESDVEISYLDFKKIKNIGCDAVTINHPIGAVSFEWNTPLISQSPNPINLECFNHMGLFLGQISDVELDGAFVSAIIASDKRFLPTQVVSVSDKLVIINNSGKPFKVVKPKRSIKLPNLDEGKNTVVKVHENELAPSVENAKDDIKETGIEPNQTEARSSFKPPRVPPLGAVNPSKPEANSSSYKFLLGKTLMRDISLDSGEMLFLAKSIITKEVIEKARENGKLVQLALHAE